MSIENRSILGDVGAVCGLVCWSHCYANAPTRFISTMYKCKRRNGDLHNVMHYATINMRRVGSPRHDVTVRPFRNFGVSSSRGIGSVYSIYILIERHPFIQRHEIYELPCNVLHINKLRLSTIVHGWSQQRYSFACPDRRMCQSQLAFCSRDYWIVSLQNSFDRLPSIVPFHGGVRLLLRSIISKIITTR